MLLAGAGLAVLSALLWALFFTSSTSEFFVTIDTEVAAIATELEAVEVQIALDELTPLAAVTTQARINTHLTNIATAEANLPARLTPSQRAQLLAALDRLRQILETYLATLIALDTAAEAVAVTAMAETPTSPTDQSTPVVERVRSTTRRIAQRVFVDEPVPPAYQAMFGYDENEIELAATDNDTPDVRDEESAEDTEATATYSPTPELDATDTSTATDTEDIGQPIIDSTTTSSDEQSDTSPMEESPLETTNQADEEEEVTVAPSDTPAVLYAE